MEASLDPCSRHPFKMPEFRAKESNPYAAWNLRQRLSPKAKPWDNGNADREKGQALIGIDGLVCFSWTS